MSENTSEGHKDDTDTVRQTHHSTVEAFLADDVDQALGAGGAPVAESFLYDEFVTWCQDIYKVAPMPVEDFRETMGELGWTVKEQGQEEPKMVEELDAEGEPTGKMASSVVNHSGVWIYTK